MISVHDQTASLADRVSRREWLRLGGLSTLGVSLTDLLRAGETPSPNPGPMPKLASDLGSSVKMLKPSKKLPALTSVWIPDMMRLNDNVTPAGQTAGFLSRLWEPERFVGDPANPDYHIEGLGLTGDTTRVRVDRRRDLLA